jgi:hypothetical protein
MYLCELERGSRTCSARQALRLADAYGVIRSQIARAWLADRATRADDELRDARAAHAAGAA